MEDIVIMREKQFNTTVTKMFRLLKNTDPFLQHFKNIINECLIIPIYGDDIILTSVATTVAKNVKYNNTFIQDFKIYVKYQNLIRYCKSVSELEYMVLKSIGHELRHVCQLIYLASLIDFDCKKYELLKLEIESYKDRFIRHMEMDAHKYQYGNGNNYNEFIDFMHDLIESLDYDCECDYRYEFVKFI